MIDMNDFESALNDAISSSENMSDNDLAAKISNETRLSAREILKIFSTREDLIGFSKLVKLLNSDIPEIQKSHKIAVNNAEFGPIILKFLSHHLR